MAPPVVVKLIVGRRPQVDGLALHPEAAFSLKKLNAGPMSRVETTAIHLSRQFTDQEAWKYGGSQHVDDVRSFTIQTSDAAIHARRYRASKSTTSNGILVYFHGGGWVLGGLDAADAICRFLSIHAGVTVVSIDYRLAPEHRYPSAVDDAVAAFRWVREEATNWGEDPARIAVGGDSAGGNLAAVVALKTREDAGGAPAFQMLLYPVTDLASKRESHHVFSDGFFPTTSQTDWFKNQYLRTPEDALSPDASPILADNFTGVASAYIATAGFDVLRDDGEAYAEKLQSAGVETKLRRHEDLMHNFAYGVGVSRTSRAAMSEAATALKAALRLT